MEFGVQLASRIDEVVDRVTHARNLGYTSAWFGDSSLLWPDAYAAMALAAQATREMRIGTGVAVAGLRAAPVTAAAVATINQLAPGRTFLGIGSGHSGWRMLGQPPLPVAQFEDYVRVVRGLLDGEQVMFTHNGRSAPIKLGLGGEGYFNLKDRVPIYVAAAGPKGRRIASMYGDGLVDHLTGPESVRAALAQVTQSAAADGRNLDGFPFIGSPGGSITVVDDDEDLTSDRVIEEVGPQVALVLHFMYEARMAGKPIGPYASDQLPSGARADWERYCAMLDELSRLGRNLSLHAGHGTALQEHERPFVTPALIQAVTLTGRPAELIDRLHDLEAAGVGLIMLAPADMHRFANLERFSKLVMSKL